MKKLKKSLATLLAVACLLAMNMTVFAAQPTTDTPVTTEYTTAVNTPVGATVLTTTGARSIYGYAADYTDYDNGSFIVNAPGSATTTGSATIKSSDFSSSSVIIYVNIYRPDGTLAKSNVKLTGNQEKVVSFTNAQPGNYTVTYAVTGSVKGWMHCWIY